MCVGVTVDDDDYYTIAASYDDKKKETYSVEFRDTWDNHVVASLFIPHLFLSSSFCFAISSSSPSMKTVMSGGSLWSSLRSSQLFR